MPQPVRTAVLPVAGLGTRFLPITKSVPKEMLPLVDRPCIEYAVAEAVAAGIERVVLVTARGKGAMSDYFDRNPELERHLEQTGKLEQLEQIRAISTMCEVVTVRQREALGLGHAVLTAQAAVGREPFAVLLADDIVDAARPAVGQLLDDWQPGQATVALVEVPRADTDRYGVCAGPWLRSDLMEVQAMVEKPQPAYAPSNFAIVGRYVLPDDVFDVLAHTRRGRGGEIQLTDALATLAGQGRVRGKVLTGRRFDTGNVLGWLEATLHYAGKRPDLAAGLQALLSRP